MIGVMTLTILDMLKESDLMNEDGDIKNLAIVCLLMLEFTEDIDVTESGWDARLFGCAMRQVLT